MMAYSSGTARCLRKPASAAALMLSNSGDRWLISITDMPEPRQSSSSSRMRSSTATGRAAGPALKLKTRFVAGAITEEDTFFLQEGLAAHFLHASWSGGGQ